jgi:serine protease inhibitor
LSFLGYQARERSIRDPKAVVEVNEVWIEAVVVTNVEIGITAMPVYDKFIVNGPFLCDQKRRSGSIMFMGGTTDRAPIVISYIIFNKINYGSFLYRF